MRTKEEYQEALDELKNFIYEELDDSNLSQNHFNTEIELLQELIDNYKENNDGATQK